jgi:hypothetical protein
MKKICIGLLLFLSVTTSQAQVDSLFPDMECRNTSNALIKLPSANKGKYTLIGMAYSKKAETNLKTWFEPVYYKFIRKPEKSDLFVEEPYNVNLYFIVMCTGITQGLCDEMIRQAKENVDPILLPYILFYQGELSVYKKRLKLINADEPYFFVLDEHGKVVYAASGAYTQDKMDAVEELLSEE